MVWKFKGGIQNIKKYQKMWKSYILYYDIE